jgi:hypothetical protein
MLDGFHQPVQVLLTKAAPRILSQLALAICGS